MSVIILEVIEDTPNFYITISIENVELMMVEVANKKDISLVTRQNNNLIRSSFRDLERLNLLYNKLPKIVNKLLKGEKVKKFITLTDNPSSLKAYRVWQEGSLLDKEKGLLIYASCRHKARYLLNKSFDGLIYKLITAIREPYFDGFNSGDDGYIVAKNSDLPDYAPKFYKQASKIV